MKRGGRPVIINMPAGTDETMRKCWPLALNAFPGAVVLWMTGPELSSVVLLEEFLGMGANPKLAVVKNGFYGESFEALEKSCFGSAPSVHMPVMPDIVRDMLHDRKVPFSKGLEEVGVPHRIVAGDALRKAVDCFEEALRIAARIAPEGA